MNDDPLPSLRDLLLRRDLTPTEERLAQEWIRQHPESATAWHEDVRLARHLRGLPPAPVPSNFTARVLAEIQRAPHARPASPAASWWQRWRLATPWPWLVPGTALLAILLAVGSWQGHARKTREEQTRNLAALRTFTELPPATLADFEVIQRFGAAASPVDYELLAALE